MKKLYFFLFILILLPLINAGIDSIDYPYNNDTLSYTSRIPLEVSSSGSTGCYFNYDHIHNVTVECEGVSLVDLPNSDGSYMLYVGDDAGSQTSIQINIVKPSGILITFLYALCVVILIGMLFVFVINIAKLATFSMTIYNLVISWSFFFALLITYQLILEYSAVPFIIDWLDLIMSISMWVVVVFPLIALLITMIKKGTDKKKPISVEEFTGRGLMKYG